MAFANQLGDFLRQEMRKRGMSNYAFAELIGVSHTTINRLVDFDNEDVGYPSVDFLIKLAAGTQTDIRYIIALVAPEDVLFDAKSSEEFENLSKQIRQLDRPYQEIIKHI